MTTVKEVYLLKVTALCDRSKEDVAASAYFSPFVAIWSISNEITRYILWLTVSTSVEQVSSVKF